MNWGKVAEQTALMVGAAITIGIVKRLRVFELASEKFGVTVQRSNLVGGMVRTAVPIVGAVLYPASAMYTIPLAQASAVEVAASSIKDANQK